MVRTDGTRVIVPVHPSWKTEFIGLYNCLRGHPWIVLLFPFFLASNWYVAPHRAGFSSLVRSAH